MAQYSFNDPSELTDKVFLVVKRAKKKLRLLMATHKNFSQKTNKMNEQFNSKYTLMPTLHTFRMKYHNPEISAWQPQHLLGLMRIT